MKYLGVDIYKTSTYNSCPLNYSDKFTKFVIECEKGNLSKEDIEGYAIIRIVKGNLPNTLKAVIIDPTTNQKLVLNKAVEMFGGYYVVTSDSRFSELCKAILGLDIHFSYPIPLHDRYEYVN